MTTLQEQYTAHPDLLRLYEDKLLQPGWAGELGVVDLAHVKSQLRLSPSLKRKCGFRPSAQRFSEAHTRAVGRDGLSAI